MSIVDVVLLFLFLFWLTSVLMLLQKQNAIDKSQRQSFEKVCSLIHEQNLTMMKIVVHLEGRKE